ncbi:MAG TPA: DUF1275 domain-containing protein [Tissierellia bacterium]|nr:DUF1275 domain-containing protein [Tissierellia bacterium]
MTQLKLRNNMEDSIAIIRGITFVGGFLNAYCFFTRGGAFGTFHTGNIVRAGVSLVQWDWSGFWAAFLPIIGAFIGALLANTVRLSAPVDLTFQRRVIFAQLLTFLVIGFLSSDATNGVVNFVVPMVSMFQLSSFRKVKDRVHNSTIMTGNLRTLGQLFFAMIHERTSKSQADFLSYFLTFNAFFIGVVAGGLISVQIGKIAIWVCALVMLMILIISRNYQRA